LNEKFAVVLRILPALSRSLGLQMCLMVKASMSVTCFVVFLEPVHKVIGVIRRKGSAAHVGGIPLQGPTGSARSSV